MLNFARKACRKQQMGSAWKPSNCLHAHRMTLPSVNPLLRQEAPSDGGHWLNTLSAGKITSNYPRTKVVN
eukprot:4300954-Amphidinium_carterae.1